MRPNGVPGSEEARRARDVDPALHVSQVECPHGIRADEVVLDDVVVAVAVEADALHGVADDHVVFRVEGGAGGRLHHNSPAGKPFAQIVVRVADQLERHRSEEHTSELQSH